MATIRHAKDFEYLRADQVVVDTYVRMSATEIAYVSRSGVDVTLGGTNLLANGSVNPRGQITSISFRGQDGTELASVSDIALRADGVIGAIEQGTGFPRIFWSADSISGSNDADKLEGYRGNDTIHGLDGSDLIGGGTGDDILVPGAGNDRVFGGSETDIVILEGARSDWQLVAEVSGVIATSLLSGDVKTLRSVEILQFADGSVAVPDLAGKQATASSGDLLFGTVGRDVLTGSDGAEQLVGNGGIDLLAGGAGDDIYTVTSDDVVVEAPAEGWDHINLFIDPDETGSVIEYSVPQNVESVAAGNDYAEYILHGNALNNSMFGAEGKDVIDGGGGRDALHGSNGDDRLDGGSDEDRLFGASGADAIDGGDGDDWINGGEGKDVVRGGAGDDRIDGDAIGAEGLTNPLEAAAAPVAERPRNVMFVSIDDLAPIFSMFPNAPFAAIAPNLEAFFGKSTVFTSAHATVPLCNPSRASVLLGVDAETSGVYNNSDSLVEAREAYPSLPAFLQDSGFLTAVAGKMFHDNEERGDPGAWTEYNPQSRAGDWTPTSFDAVLSAVNSVTYAPDVPDEAFADMRSLEDVEAFLARTHDDPFFFGFGQLRPHAPQYVPKEYYDLYPLDSIEIPSAGKADLADLEQLGLAIAREMNPGVLTRDETLRLSPLTSEVQIKLAIQSYLASVSYADAVFGRAMEALQSSAHAQDTAVILWSDHGFHLAEKFHFSKFTLWEQGTRAPLAFHIPGVTDGATVDSSVSLLDMYKTVADMLGLEAPEHVQGNSLFPLILDPSLEWDHPSITNFNGNFSVRSNDYRYIQYWDGSEELYDHRIDPEEVTNIAGQAGSEAIIAALRRYLPGSDDVLSGEGGDDSIIGGAGADRLDGGVGNDVLEGGIGNDILEGGEGSDTASYAGAGAGVNVSLNQALAQNSGGAGRDLLAGIEHLLGSRFGDTLRGAAGGNRIEGGAGNDRLYGLSGDDMLIGGEGQDQLNGGTGADEQAGGAGNDIYYVDSAGDAVFEAGGGGNDLVVAFADHVLADNVERLRLTGGARNGTGNELANIITGSGGDDGIKGLGGDDRVAGSGGGDLVSGGQGNDFLHGGTGDDRIAGDGDDDRIDGSEGADVLAGGGGLDRLSGGAGDDGLDGGSAGDILMGGLGRDSLTGGSGADRFIFAEPDAGDTVAAADLILDFSRAEGDLINLRQIDAIDGTAGDDRFSFVGTAGFSGAAGELRYELTDAGAVIEGDLDGDRIADFVLVAEAATSLTALDFVL